MNNKMKAIAAVSALTCLCFSGTVFAYLTATDQKTNTFTIGNVSAELTEPNFEEPEGIVYPDYVYDKDPTVTNTGNTDALVFIEYTIPMATLSVVDSSTDEAGAPDRTALFTTLDSDDEEGVNSDWVSLKDPTEIVESGSVVGTRYYYAYKNILKKDKSTSPVFSQIQVANYANGDIDQETYDVDVYAKVIQADNLHMGSDTVTLSELKDAYSYFVTQED